MAFHTNWLRVGSVAVLLGSAFPFACEGQGTSPQDPATVSVGSDGFGGGSGTGPSTGGSGFAGHSDGFGTGDGGAPGGCPIRQPAPCSDASGVSFVCGLPARITLTAQTADAIYVVIDGTLTKIDKSNASLTPVDTKGGHVQDFLIADSVLYWHAAEGGIWQRGLDGLDEPVQIAACAPGGSGLAIDSNFVYFGVSQHGVHRASRTEVQASKINLVFGYYGNWIAVEAPRIYSASWGLANAGIEGSIFAGDSNEECTCTCPGSVDAGPIDAGTSPGANQAGGSPGGGGSPPVPPATVCAAPNGETGLGGAGGFPGYQQACGKMVPIFVMASLNSPSMDAQYIYFLHHDVTNPDIDLKRIAKSGTDEQTLLAAASLAMEHLEVGSFVLDGDFIYVHLLQKDSDVAARSSGRIVRTAKDGSNRLTVADLPPSTPSSNLFDMQVSSIIVDDSYIYFQRRAETYCSSEIGRVPKPGAVSGDAAAPSDVGADGAIGDAAAR